MTSRPDHREPLDDQERELAARLARVAPANGPSPALDARILAAARAAAGQRPRQGKGHWAWLGVPPALVTGAGVAAAAVLALGLVWQLRPPPGRPAVYGEGEGEGPAEEVFIVVAPEGTPRAPFANPPPFPAAAPASATAPSPRRATRPDASGDDGAPREAMARASGRAAAAEARAATTAAEVEAEAVRRADLAAAAEKSAAPLPAAPPPPAAPAPAPAPVLTEKPSHATYTSAARAGAERRARASAPAPVPADADDGARDRIEVTGARVAGDRTAAAVSPAALPVDDDARLPAADWLQRIRERRDTGDAEGARESLRRFRREHPRVRLPDDLRRLATDPRP